MSTRVPMYSRICKASKTPANSAVSRSRSPRLPSFVSSFTPIPGTYDVAHLQQFHRQIFGGIYPWAGEIRTVTIAKGIPFAMPEHVSNYLANALQGLAGRTTFVDPPSPPSLHGSPTTSPRSTQPTHSGKATAGPSELSSAHWQRRQATRSHGTASTKTATSPRPQRV